MSRRRRFLTLFWALLLTTSIPALAHDSVLEMAAQPSIECGGQYECRADAPLALEEAIRSIAYPQASAADFAASLAARPQEDAVSQQRSSPGG